MRLSADNSLLLVIDIQERLAPHVADHARLIARSAALLDGAKWFGVPALLTEHSPQHIGPVIEPIRRRFAAADILVKHHFSAADEPAFSAMLARHPERTLVVAGMEAHVCVLQTVLALRALGRQVLVVADAIGSRAVRQADRQWALERMSAAGCSVAGTETVLFEWTGDAARPEFRSVLGLVKALDR